MRRIDAAVEALRGRFAIPASCLGVGLISAWTELSFINPPVAYASAPAGLFLVFNMASIVSGVVIALCLRRRMIRRTLVSRDLALVLTLALLLTATCVDFALTLLGIGAPALLTASAIVGGVGIAFLFIMWFEVISHLNPARMLLCYATAAIGRVFLIWLCSGMGADRLWASLCLVAMLAVASLRRARDVVAPDAPSLAGPTKADEGTPALAEEKCSFPLRPLLVVVFGTAALSFVLRSVGNVWGTNGNPGVLLAGAMVAVAVLCTGEGFRFKWLWKASLAFMVCGVAAFAIGGGALLLLAGVLVCIAYELCLMLAYSILSDLVYRSFYSSTFLFSVELAIALAAGCVGDLLVDLAQVFTPEHPSVALVAVGGVLAGLFAAACIHAFSDTSLKEDASGKWSVIIRKPFSQDTGAQLGRTRIGLRCRELASEVGLSRREEEVLLLLAQGKKPAAMAQELGISASTVTTHKKHVYQKLDVHSAKELRARIGNAEEPDGAER